MSVRHRQCRRGVCKVWQLGCEYIAMLQTPRLYQRKVAASRSARTLCVARI